MQTTGGGRTRATTRALEVALLGTLVSLALVFGYIEALFPLPVAVPGIKLGLGNVVVLFALVSLGPAPACAVMLVKVTVSSLLFGGPAVLAYSMAGGIASFLGMAAAVRLRPFGIEGVSCVGGVLHMAGQAAVVCLVLSPQAVAGYLPVLLLAGLATGALTGCLCRAVLRAVGRSGPLAQMRRARARDARRKGGEGAQGASGDL